MHDREEPALADIEDADPDEVEENDVDGRERRNRTAYLAAYACPEVAEWLTNLTPEQRREAKRLGLDKPALPTISGAAADYGANVTDAVDYDDDGEAIEAPDTDAATSDAGAEAEEESELAKLRQRYADGLRSLAMLLVESRNARVTIEVFALVTGLGYEGISMASIGRRHGLTRAAVSKRCIEMCSALGLQPSRAMMVKFTEAAA